MNPDQVLALLRLLGNMELERDRLLRRIAELESFLTASETAANDRTGSHLLED